MMSYEIFELNKF